MSESDKDFLHMCKYFWNNKEDMERYIGFDIQRLQRLDPALAQAWLNYKEAYIYLDYLTDRSNL